LHDGFGNPKYAPCPLLTNMVTAGYFGVKSGEGFYSYKAGSKNWLLVKDSNDVESRSTTSGLEVVDLDSIQLMNNSCRQQFIQYRGYNSC